MGGRAGGKGYLIQAIVVLLDSLTSGNDWLSVTIEPSQEYEKVDILWRYLSDRKAVQVKHSQNTITKPMAKKWATELKATANASKHSLILLGPCSNELTKIKAFGAVSIPTPLSVNIQALRSQAAHSLDIFLRLRNARNSTTPGAREMIVDAMATRLSEYSTDGKEISRESFETLLSTWVSEFDSSVALSEQPIPNELRRQYCRWIQELFANFWVPGLGVLLSIEHAFIQIDVMRDDKSIIGTKGQLDEQLRNYLEYGYHNRDTSHSTNVSFDLLLPTVALTVLVGSPGAGKSTALKRLAWQMSRNDKIVIHIRLPLLIPLINIGMSFEEAVAKVAFDGSSINMSHREQLLAACEVLLCDGLDECGPYRQLVSQKLMQWSYGHTNSRVCVTTRPIGHEAAFLPNFSHYKLIAPNHTQIRELASTLFRECNLSATPDADCKKFLETISPSRHGIPPVNALASQNPLLLGFLVKLSIDQVKVGRLRCDLYQKIFLMMLRTKPNDREVLEISERVALAVIQTLAWKLTASPFADYEIIFSFLVSHIEKHFGISVLEADNLVFQSIRFWEERRLLESITVGTDRKIFFVHLSLQEFAAAQFASELQNDAFEEWIKDVRRMPSWRQPILLTCGLDTNDRTINALLELDEPASPISCEALLASKGYLESALHQERTIDTLISSLGVRITSNVPLICIEATLQLAKLSNHSKCSVSTQLKQWKRDTAWNHMCLFLLHLITGEDSRVVDEFKEWFLNHKPVNKHFPRLTKRNDLQAIPEEGREVQNEIIRIGMERVFATQDRGEIDEFIKKIRDPGKLSAFILEDLQDRLTEIGLGEAARRIWPSRYEYEMRSDIIRGIERWNAGKLVLLKLVSHACGPSPKQEIKPPFASLSAFFAAIDYWESSAGETGALEKTDPVADASGAEIVRAVAISLGINFSELAAEADCAVQMCESDPQCYLSIIQYVDVKCDWSRLSKANVNGELIVSGILHCFSLFSRVAAHFIFRSGNITAQTRMIIRQTLDSEFDHCVYLGSLLVYHCCGDSATDILLDRLNRPIRVGHSSLFEALAKYSSFQRRNDVLSVFFKYMKVRSPELASEISKALEKFNPPLVTDHIQELRQTYVFWSKFESENNVNASEGIRSVPPSPRPQLLRVLDDLGDVTFDEWVSLTKDEQYSVSEIAEKAILRQISTGEASLADVIELIERKVLSASILKSVLKLDIRANSSLANVAERLLTSSDVSLRLATISQLTGEWIESAKATNYLKQAVQDESPAIRTLATRILRLFY